MLSNLYLRVRDINLWIIRKSPVDFRILVTLISLTFVLSVLLSNEEGFYHLSRDAYDYFWILWGLIIAIISLIFNAIAWRELVDWLGYRRSTIHFIPLFLSSNLLKYLPGGIWHFIDRLRSLRNEIGVGPALASVFLEPFLMLVAAFLLIPFGGLKSGFALVCLLPLLLLTAPFREPLLRFLERNKTKQLIKVDSSFSHAFSSENLFVVRSPYPFKALAIEVLFILFRFASFFCCLLAFSTASYLPLGTWVSIFSFAWAVGLVIPAAPGGLGVFEAALLLGLGSTATGMPLLGILFGYRLITTLADIVAALIFPIQRKLLASITYFFADNEDTS